MTDMSQEQNPTPERLRPMGQPSWMKNLQGMQEQMKTGVTIPPEAFQMTVLEAFVGIANGMMNVSSNMEKQQAHFMEEVKTLRDENSKLREDLNTHLKMINSLRDEIKRMKGSQLDLEDRIDSPECNKAKRGVVVRNYKEGANEEEEAWNRTHLMQHLGTSPDKVECMYRMNISKKAKERFEKAGRKVERLLLIRFHSTEAKYEFMGELPKLRNMEGGDLIHVTHEIPLCRIREQRELDRLGAEWRKECKGRKTRLNWQGMHLVLQCREPSQQKWTAYSLNELTRTDNTNDVMMTENQSPDKAPAFWQEI